MQDTKKLNLGRECDGNRQNIRQSGEVMVHATVGIAVEAALLLRVGSGLVVRPIVRRSFP